MCLACHVPPVYKLLSPLNFLFTFDHSSIFIIIYFITKKKLNYEKEQQLEWQDLSLVACLPGFDPWCVSLGFNLSSYQFSHGKN
jgi:predicted carbohydrate-binding protein with CBM5 and CBM33 domain